MYTPGKLIYFSPFYSHIDVKNKYFLVLKVIDGNAILACLPSSQQYLPQNHKIEHGCLEITDSGISCYIFKASNPVTKSGWCFPLDTILYPRWVSDYDVMQLNNTYTIPNVDYEVVGELTEVELKNIIECFLNSKSLSRKYKRMLL